MIEDTGHGPERESEPPFPGSVLASGIIWILIGCLSILCSLASLALPVLLNAGKAGGKNPTALQPTPSEIVGFWLGLVMGTGFVIFGVRTVSGWARDTAIAGGLSLVIGLLYLALGTVIIFGVRDPTVPQAVMGAAAIVLGAAFLLPGGLALAGRSRYQKWRRFRHPPPRRHDRREQEESFHHTARPAAARARRPEPESDEEPVASNSTTIWILSGVAVAIMLLCGGGIASVWYFWPQPKTNPGPAQVNNVPPASAFQFGSGSTGMAGPRNTLPASAAPTTGRDASKPPPPPPVPAIPELPLLRTIKVSDRCVWCVGFSGDGETLITADGYFGPPGFVKLWKTATGDPIKTLLSANSDVLAAALSPDGQWAAFGGDSPGLHVFDLRTKKKSALAQPSYVRAIAFSPDGKYLASGCEQVVKVWDASSMKELWSQKLSSGLSTWRIATRLDFSADSKLVAVGSGNDVCVYDAASGTKAGSGRHAGLVLCAAFTKQGNVFASGGMDNTIKLWDRDTFNSTGALNGHSDWVYCVAFAKDGKTLASVGREGTVLLWDVPRGKILASVQAHTAEANCVTFSPDGKTLASSGLDGAVKLWDVSQFVDR